MQLPGVFTVQERESVVCSFHVCCRRRVDCLQLPCVFKKGSRLIAAFRSVEERESVVCSFNVCSRRRVGCLQLPDVSKKESRLFAASMCVQEGV